MTAHESKFVDGRWVHSLRQSWLKTAATCPERARAQWACPDERRESDAAGVGTALHTVQEIGMTADLDLQGCHDVWEVAYAEIEAMPSFVNAKYTPKTARVFGHRLVEHWYREVRPTLDPDAQYEVHFEDVPLIDDEFRVVTIEGTVDYFDGTLRDLKSSGGRQWQPWQEKRSNVQASCYTYAAWGLGWVTEQPVPFEFIIVSEKGVQRFTAERTTADWDWLAQQAESYAVLIEAELAVWPKSDDHALCSARWCDHWDACRGLALGKNPW